MSCPRRDYQTQPRPFNARNIQIKCLILKENLPGRLTALTRSRQKEPFFLAIELLKSDDTFAKAIAIAILIVGGGG
jgi:hypothetical protein